MRKCRFKVYDPRPEADQWQDGVFHQWGSGILEAVGEPAVQYSVGIVEAKNGAVYTVNPFDIVFTFGESE